MDLGRMTALLELCTSTISLPLLGLKSAPSLSLVELTTGKNLLSHAIPMISQTSLRRYGGVAVDLQVPGTIMVAALNSWWPQGIIYRSKDSGATWTAIWDWESYRK